MHKNTQPNVREEIHKDFIGPSGPFFFFSPTVDLNLIVLFASAVERMHGYF